ncbi:unnamed protein product, partial [Meganyctiphanes norvegica]
MEIYENKMLSVLSSAPKSPWRLDPSIVSCIQQATAMSSISLHHRFAKTFKVKTFFICIVQQMWCPFVILLNTNCSERVKKNNNTNKYNKRIYDPKTWLEQRVCGTVGADHLNNVVDHLAAGYSLISFCRAILFGCAACGCLWSEPQAHRSTKISPYVRQGHIFPISANKVASCKSLNSQSAEPAPVCSGGCGNGQCTGTGQCTCSTGWTGQSCGSAVCSGGCGNGQCASPGRCTCSPGWTGTTCRNPVCSGGCGHGQCSRPNQCTCNQGYKGPNCGSATCLVMACPTNAYCQEGSGNSAASCFCNDGYRGHTGIYGFS